METCRKPVHGVYYFLTSSPARFAWPLVLALFRMSYWKHLKLQASKTFQERRGAMLNVDLLRYAANMNTIHHNTIRYLTSWPAWTHTVCCRAFRTACQKSTLKRLGTSRQWFQVNFESWNWKMLKLKQSPVNGFQSARKSNAIVTEVCLWL